MKSKWKMSVVLAAAVLGLSACGGGSDGPAQKSLFSVWKNEATGAVLDISAAGFGAPFGVIFFLEGGGSCQCNVTVVGDQAGGKFVNESCGPRAGTGATAQQCSVLNTSFDYTNRDAVLTISQGNESSVWR